MATPGHRNSASMSFSLERKAYLVVSLLTNDPRGFSLVNLREDVNHNRGLSTVLKLNHKRLAWGDKSSFESLQYASTSPVPYRSVELAYVRQMFVESKYPSVLLCVIRVPKQTKYKYEIAAFRLQDDHDVRIFLDLFAALTQIPVTEDHRKARDRGTPRTMTSDPSELYSPPPSTLGFRGRSTPGRSPRVHGGVAGLPVGGRISSNAARSRPIYDESGQHQEERVRRRKNHDTVDSRTARHADGRTYADQTRSVVFSDGENSETPTTKRRSDPSRRRSGHGYTNGGLSAKSLSSPSIPEASYSARAYSGGDPEIVHVPLNDSENGSEEEGAGRSSRNLQRRTTLVDNGIVKVTVEEYQDPAEEEEKAPDLGFNDQESNPYSSNSQRNLRFANNGSGASHSNAGKVSTPVARHSHRSRKLDTVDRGTTIHADPSPPTRSTAMTSSVRKVFSRPSVRRSQSESEGIGRHRRVRRDRYLEIPPNESDVYLTRPIQRQHTAVDSIYQARSKQPTRTIPESVYQSRSTTVRRQPVYRVPDDVYQMRSATLRSQPINFIPEPVYQSRKVTVGHASGNSDRRIVGGSNVHRESRHEYEWWDTGPVQPVPHTQRSSVYHLEQRHSRR